jgi:hypothetical protein
LNLRRIWQNLQFWKAPARPWPSFVITCDLRVDPTNLDTFMAAVVDEEHEEEYLVDTINRVYFPKYGWRQLYVEWSISPLAFFQASTAIPTVPEDDLKQKYDGKEYHFTQEEYFMQRIAELATDRAEEEAAQKNRSAVMRNMLITVILVVCMTLLINQFGNSIKKGTAVNPITIVGNAASGLMNGGKK